MRLDSLSAEKDALGSTVRQREADLQAAQSLVRETEAALSQEQQLRFRERDELQGRLADKVVACPALHTAGSIQPTRSECLSQWVLVGPQGCASHLVLPEHLTTPKRNPLPNKQLIHIPLQHPSP